MRQLLYLPFLFVLSGLSGQNEIDDISKMVKDYYYFPSADLNNLDVEFSYGLGELTLKANDRKDAIDGTVKYNPEMVTPAVDFKAFGTKGKLDVNIESIDSADHHLHFVKDDWRIGFDSDLFRSEVDFKLPKDIPISIDLEFGLGDAQLDFTNLTIADLDLECGLSDVKLLMSSVNPRRCKSVRIESGLGDLNAIGLGNLRARNIDIDVGLGSANIDLTGQKIEDVDIDVNVSLGSLDITLPRDSNIRLTVNDTFLSSVDVSGLVKDHADEWISSEWLSGRPTVIIEVNVGIGSVDIDLRD